MSFAPAVLAVALLGGIAPQMKIAAQNPEPARTETTRTCMAPTRTGSFRITATTADSSNSKIGMILLENVDGCLEATMITDEGGPAIIEHIAMNDDVFSGSIRMLTGTAKISFRISQAGVDGSIVAGGRQWHLSGRRTI